MARESAGGGRVVVVEFKKIRGRSYWGIGVVGREVVFVEEERVGPGMVTRRGMRERKRRRRLEDIGGDSHNVKERSYCVREQGRDELK